MKAKRLISLLLCFIMVVGTLPMSVMAEDTATVVSGEEEVSFEVMLDFNRMETTTTANADSLLTMVSRNEYFSTSVYNGTGGLSYVERDDNGDMALRTTSNHGINVIDSKLVLSDVSFVLEFDVRFEKVSEGYNTVQLCFMPVDATKTTNTALTPININKVQGSDGEMYPATYHMVNNQNIGAVTRPDGVSANLITYPDQWYHYAFYIDSATNAINAYRDGAPIWSSTLTAFPDDMTACHLRLHSGAGSSVTYYDNIHIQSLNSTDIDAALDFENVTFDGEATSVNATADMLNSVLGSGRFYSPYVHATHTTIETDGTNSYIVGKSVGASWAATGNMRSFFQLGDSEAKLSSQSWTMAFDMCVPGITNASGTDVISSYEVSLLGLIVDGTYNHILTLKTNGQLGRAKAGNYTTQQLTKGEWYRIFVSHDADNQKISFALLGNSEGYVNLGTYDFTPNQSAAETFFRFGYGWQTGQYCKFYFDNIVMTTETGLDIDLDFENGTAGDSVSLTDLSLGGADTYTALNGGKFSKTPNDNFKYVDDADGNTFFGSYVGHNAVFANIYDRTLQTLSKKFVISFDFKVNEIATTYTMATWRTSAANVPLWIIETTDGQSRLRIRPKLTGSSYAYSTPYLTSDVWYNFATLIDPVNKTATFYMGGLDTEPIYTTTFEHDISSATWSSFSIGPGSKEISTGVNDYIGYDNIRIYTVAETVESTTPPDSINTATLPASGVIVETDFEGFEAGTAMTSEVWNTVTPFWATATDGTVVESNGNKHFQPLNGSGETSFNISSFNASPYTDGVIAVETDFTLGDNTANSGNLVIAALKRVGIDGTTVNVPLLTADSTGKLTVAQHALGYTLPAETVRIRLELSYAFHTVNLYINNEATATGIPLKVDTTLTTPQSYFTDSFGNTYELPFTGYTYDYGFYNNGLQIVNANGVNAMFPHYYENYGYAETLSYIRDSIDMFGASADEAWSFAIDNLKIYQDKEADIYFNGFDGWESGIVGSSNANLPAELPFATATSDKKEASYVNDGGNTVLATVADGSSVYNASFFIKDANKFLATKTFVLEFDIKYNPDYESVDLGENTGMAIVTDLAWNHSLRLYEDGGYGIPTAGRVDGYFKDNDWSRVQALCKPNASGTKHTVRFYVDGVLASNTASFSLLNTLRIGCEANSYDAKFDNIRIYLSDKPDAFESVIKGSLDGKSLFALEVADTASLEKMMANEKDGLVWNFKDFDTTSNNINEATVNVLLNQGEYVRVVHNNIKDTSAYNIFVNKAALEGHKQYVFETEVRYTCPTGFELEVLSTFDAATQSKDKLVYILGTSREIVFNRNGFTYNLTDANGNKLYAEDVTEDATKFTKIAVIVDEAAGNYSVYVNGRVAYYDYGGEIVTATAIDIDKTPIYEPSGLITSMASTISLLNMSTSTSADALLDIKSANFYVLRTGVAPYVMATQSKIEATKFDVRFIAPIDMLYGTEVGFDITTDQQNSKEITRSTNVVYSSIKAIDSKTNAERDFLAEEFNGTHLAVISVTGASVIDTVEFTVKPFIIIGDSKIYNESFTVTYSRGEVVTE